MNALFFLVDIAFTLYLMLLLLSLWLQLVQADFYNPFSQFVVKATHPVVGPLRRIVPSIGRFDTATLIFALLVAGAKVFFTTLIKGVVFTNPLGLLLASVATVVNEGLQLMIYVLLLRAILSWISQGFNPLEQVFHQLTDPILAPIRRLIPPMGGLDLSVMFAIIGLVALQILIGADAGLF